MKNKFVVVIPNIRSGHNVGSIFRTADGAGVDKIYITGYSPRPPHKEIAKVALGAEFSVPWEAVKNTTPLLKKLKKQGYQIVALEQTPKSGKLFTWKPVFPLALVLGNEVLGISKNILKYCDEVVEIPMRGKKKSLNVSVAGGVAIYYIANFKNKT